MRACRAYHAHTPTCGVPDRLADQLAQVERSLLVEALRREDGNATEAARRLKLPRKTFYDKLARHGLKAGTYR